MNNIFLSKAEQMGIGALTFKHLDKVCLQREVDLCFQPTDWLY